MTFKHIKFEDSVTMRSLEKVAKEKGFIKEEPLNKTASLVKKADLTVSSDLTQNILKLSAGLREAGFDKYADELENKFVVYKQAQTLYETSKETGEDLVDAAHPEGSHKLENVDSSESVVETIIDQRLKNLQVINKKPTGKLANSRDILKAVKIVLAQDEDKFKDLRRQKALEEVQKAKSYLNSIKGVEEPTTGLETLPTFGPGAITGTIDLPGASENKLETGEIFHPMTGVMNEKMAKEMLRGLDSDSQRLSNKLQNSDAFDFNEKSTLKKLLNAVNNAKLSYQNAINYFNGSYDKFLIANEESVKAKAKREQDKAELQKLKNTEIANLNNWASQIDTSNYPTKSKTQAYKWITEQKNEVNMATTIDALNNIKKENANFYNTWISPLKVS